MSVHIIDKKGKIIFSAEDCRNLQEGLFPVKINGKWGYINQEGKIVIPCQFDDVREFKNGIARVCKNKRWGSINSKGVLLQQITRPEESDVDDIQDGIVRILRNTKSQRWRYVDIDGHEIINTDSYSFISNFNNGFAVVERVNDNEFERALINTKGDIIIPFGRYNSICIIDGGLAMVEVYKNRLYGYINILSGVEVVPLGKYDSVNVDPYFGYISEVRKGDKIGYIDIRTCKEITPIIFESSVTRVVSNSDNMTIIKPDEQEIEQKNISYIYNGEEQKTYILKDINPINIGIYNEGLCPIVKNGKLGFIDKHGEIAIPCQFDRKLAWGTTFKDGLCIIQKDTSSCQGNVIIDKTGHVLQTIPRDYRATYLGEHIFLLETNNPSINFSSRKIITIVPLKWTNRSLKQLK